MIAEIEQIKRVLWVDWDPIGVNGIGSGDDEYDGYASHISVMLSEGKGAEDVSDYLRWAALENMGLSDAGDTASIAQKIIRIHGK